MPLSGRLILDYSTLLPGPLVGKLLVQKGARVIKIENPKIPDRARSMGAAYSDLNEDKEVLFLDLVDRQDRKKFEALVRQADGLIEGFRPQTKLKLGLDEQSLHSLNPKLCILSIVGYPESGPWKDRAGHDINFAAVTGCLSLFNEMPGLPLGDLFGAYEGAFALTAALDSAQRGRKGSRIVISLSEALRKVQSTVIRDYQSTGNIPAPGKTLFSGQFPCYRIYQTADGRRVTIGAIETKFWQRVCEILGLPELVNQGYATGEEGKQVIEKVQSALQSKPWPFWEPLFDSADCCVEPVLDYSEVYPKSLLSPDKL